MEYLREKSHMMPLEELKMTHELNHFATNGSGVTMSCWTGALFFFFLVLLWFCARDNVGQDHLPARCARACFAASWLGGCGWWRDLKRRPRISLASALGWRSRTRTRRSFHLRTLSGLPLLFLLIRHGGDIFKPPPWVFVRTSAMNTHTHTREHNSASRSRFQIERLLPKV